MMYSPKSRLLTAACFLIVVASLAFAQVPSRTKFKFDINVPYELKMGQYLLPAGHYVLFQSSRDPNLFSLHARNLANEPIAMIQTIRVRHWTIPEDRETKMMLDINESSQHAVPVLAGWNVPYADGWEIVNVRATSDSTLSRVR